MDYLIGISVADFLEILEEVAEYGRQQKDRVRNSGAGRRER